MTRESRRPPRARDALGFTLIEVLIAMVLLVAGLALAFATLGAATRTTARGEAMAERSERMRSVEGFLRTRIAGTRPIPFDIDQTRAIAVRFIGERERMRFVADIPDYLGRGGPYLHDVRIEDAGDGVRMTLALTMVQAGKTVEERDPRPPELLVEGLREARFRYRSLDQEGRLGDWVDEWEATEQLPLLVEVTMVDRNGTPWPPLVVSLPLAPAFSAFSLPVQTQ
ncbi:prepilin-type N-terminal cleavage/methylation domain-containing protein [Lysobacter arvi]|uniref:Prepilin-type N-terminal cleavage/methylation domain-containing protein n=1 Tax=Lysobacter arvi TaxID=3038776 RepID=A0ABU1CF67_9GAMM|nr:prepilin-type N-terminal cleavage/methylation domain-containing protein [Lysobacter arvi]MDR0183588.1 prepilin-type N-terminal cleavage/methylation domain-containing protein [Lysobacter arvi]